MGGTLWDGRFTGGPAEEMVRFSECIAIDLQMWREDIEGSRAHAVMLGKVGLLDDESVNRILTGLDQVAEELESGAFVPGPEHEDIHMAVETRLTEIVGDPGRRLHTARSRNDQVATDVRLWMRSRLTALQAALDELVRAICDRVRISGQTLMPGFTHLQQGQPIWLGHHLLAHAWTIHRDSGRVADALSRLDACPLGAGAMAGTPHPIDRHHSASLLGFSGPIQNAMDAVAARDHQLEAASACAITMTHLSRISEELILWSTREFGFLTIGEAYTTGSSIMPQKRNPDAAELIRGKSGRVIGSLNALLTMVKGLPLAYNRDLQEDREALFDAIDTTIVCTRIMAGMFADCTFHDVYDLSGGFLLATEIADYLVTKGLPFREAHHVSGSVVAWCEARDSDFTALAGQDLTQFHPLLDEGVREWLVPEAAVERRTSFGGTAWSEVRRQLELLAPQGA